MPSGGTSARHGKGRGKIGDFPFANLTLPPWGSYDPGLSAQIGQSQRGLLDTLQDIRTQNRQTRQDFRFGKRTAKRTTRRAIGDIRFERQGTKINFAQDLQDLALAKQRGTQDYGIALANLGRKYATLASSQAQQANAAGLTGGYAAAAAAKRSANQAVERQPLDISQQRNLQDIALRRSRTETDFVRTMQRYGVLGHRARQDLHSQLHQLRQNLSRTLLQNKRERSRAIREQGFFALDQTAQAFFAAHQAHPHIHFPSMKDIRRGTNKQGRNRGGQ